MSKAELERIDNEELAIQSTLQMLYDPTGEYHPEIAINRHSTEDVCAEGDVGDGTIQVNPAYEGSKEDWDFAVMSHKQSMSTFRS